MARTLSARQAEELHKSIIAYLSASGLPQSAAALRHELQMGEDSFDLPTMKKYEGLMERKWTGVMRLQKKILELETQKEVLQSELKNATPTSTSSRNQDPASWLPNSAPKYTLESHRDSVNCVAFHPIFSSLASGSDDFTIKIWDWEMGELEQTLKGHTRSVNDVHYGGPRNGVLLASCSSDMSIKLWDPADDYKNIRTLVGHDHSVSAVRFIPSGAAGAPYSGNLLVSASRDKGLRIWDVTTGYCLKTLQGHSAWVRDACPSADGHFLLSTGDDMTARLWDLSASNPVAKLTMVGHEHVIECCALAPPASYQYFASLAGLKKAPPASSTAEFMATGSRDKTIKLWDARGTCLKTLVGHDDWVRALVFHPGGKYIFSVSDDKTLRCWDLGQEGKCVKHLVTAHGRFISCLRWAPGIVQDAPDYDGSGMVGQDVDRNAASKKIGTSAVKIRCVIATGSVDSTVKIFAN